MTTLWCAKAESYMTYDFLGVASVMADNIELQTLCMLSAGAVAMSGPVGVDIRAEGKPFAVG